MKNSTKKHQPPKNKSTYGVWVKVWHKVAENLSSDDEGRELAQKLRNAVDNSGNGTCGTIGVGSSWPAREFVDKPPQFLVIPESRGYDRALNPK